MATPQTRRENEVWQACDDLFAQGLAFHQMTGDDIIGRLQELGYKKGNRNQIYQYRKTWAESRGVKALTVAAAPTMLTDPISRAAALVRDEIVAEAEAMVIHAKEEAQQIIKALNQKHEQLHSDYTHLTKQHDALLQDYTALKAHHLSLSTQLIQEQQQRAVSDERAHNTEQQLQQLREETQRRVEEQQRLYEQQLAYVKEESQAATRHYQAEIESWRHRLEEQRHQAIVKLDAQRVALQKREKQYERALTQERATQQLVAALQQTLQRNEAEIADYKADYKNVAAELQEKSNTLSTTTLALKQAQLGIEESKQQLARYASDRLEAKQRIDRLEETVRQLTLTLERQSAAGKDDGTT